jgi:hypothetical protein
MAYITNQWFKGTGQRDRGYYPVRVALRSGSIQTMSARGNKSWNA